MLLKAYLINKAKDINVINYKDDSNRTIGLDVATNLKVCPNDSSESSSFFTFSSNNKLLGFNINDEISLSLPGFTSELQG